jgi:alkylhydroperoxidase family enzyme
MRLPYASSEPPTADAEAESVYAAVAARRAPRPLQSLDLTLLHSPPVAMGWNSFLGAIRGRTTLTPDIRELAISRVAVLNAAWYEWHHHAPLLQKDGKLGDAGLQIVLEAPALPAGGAQAREGPGLTPKQWAVLDYADQMTRLVKVEDTVFKRLQSFFSDREVVEVTAVVATYNCVSRFLVALDVGEGNVNKLEIPKPQ